MSGWIKLHRKFLDWEWRQDPKMVALFVHILLNVNHEKKRWKGTVVDQGQMVTSLKHLSANTGLTISSLRNCLNKLKSTQELTIKTTNKYSIITVTKWSSYQLIQSLTDTQTDTLNDKQLTNKQQTTNNKQEDKEDKEVKKEDYMSTIVPIADPPAAQILTGNGHCPHEKIIALYHQTLPVLPQVRVWTDTRKKHLACRWKENSERQNLAWWEKFFTYIGTCKFLTGETTGRDGRSFLASMDWIVKPENFVKIIEGKYE